MNNIKKKVCLVFGGASGEHNVSIKSAINVFSALQSKKNKNLFQTELIYVDIKGRWWGANVANKAMKKKESLDISELPEVNSKTGFTSFPFEANSVDIWFPVLHGPNGEDGSIQGLFKLTGKCFVGSGVLGSALGMDKIAMKAAFKAAGLPQVPYVPFDSNINIRNQSHEELANKIEQSFGYPCFVKPANMGSSVGITKALDRHQFFTGIKTALTFDSRIVIEKCIEARELECAILGKKNIKTSIVGEIIHQSDWFDYQTKYLEGKSLANIPALISNSLSDQIRELSIKACNSLAVDSIARVDFFYEKFSETIYLNEVNTLPGFTNQSMYPSLWAASGLKIEDLVFELLKIAQQ